MKKFLVILFAALILFAGCDNGTTDDGNGKKGNGESTKPPNLSALNAKITEAEDAKDGVITAESAEKAALGRDWVTADVMKTFEEAIETAKTARSADKQSAVDRAVTTLSAAIEKFKSAIRIGSKSSGFTQSELNDLIDDAQDAKTKVQQSTDGTDVSPQEYWVTSNWYTALNSAISNAQSQNSTLTIDEKYMDLLAAFNSVNSYKQRGTGTPQRTITITGLNNFTSESELTIVLFENNNRNTNANITIENFIYGIGSISNNTATFVLKTFVDSKRWTGSGSYYVAFSSETKDYISKSKITFSDSAPSPSVSFSNFEFYVFEYTFGELTAEIEGFTIPADGITLDEFCLYMTDNEMNYAQMMLASDSLSAPLYKDKALTSPFSGADKLKANTKIYSFESLEAGGGPSPNQEPRTITITGLDSSFYDVDLVVGLFSTANFSEDTEPLAYGYADYGELYNGNVTVYLYLNKDEDEDEDEPWYGNGQYYVGLLFDTYDNKFLYRSKTQVTFSNSNPKPTVSFSNFKQNSIFNPANVTELTENTFANGSITSYSGEQWFKFTATAQNQYIHVILGTLKDLYVQVYDSEGDEVGPLKNFETNNMQPASRNLSVGQVYYIKVTPDSNYYGGTYKIAYNTSTTAPGINLPSNAIKLTEGIWADGGITYSIREQWFKFFATAETQYIHINFGTPNNLYIQLYNNNGITVGSKEEISSSSKYASLSLTIGTEYYIMLTPRYSDNFTYKIAFATSSTAPDVIVPSPSNAIELTQGKWTDGNIPSSSGEQWFKFKATSDKHYIHVSFGTLEYMYIQLYESDYTNTVGNQMFLSSYSKYISQSLTTGQDYYIKITPFTSSDSGTYQIAVNTSDKVPPITLPNDATTLSPDTWVNGDLTLGGEQWFKFKATDNAYIQATFVTMDSINGLNIQLYNSDGNTVGDKKNLWSSSSSYAPTTLFIGQDYYIKVTPYDSYYLGTYKIAYSKTYNLPSQ